MFELPQLELYRWVALVIAFLLVSTWLLKRYTKAETYHIASLIRTKKALPWIDAAAERFRGFRLFSEFGIILGFGAVAVDFLYGRKLGGVKRIALFIGSWLLLSLVPLGFDMLMGGSASSNSAMGNYFWLVVASFGFFGMAGFVVLGLLLYGIEILLKESAGESTCPGVGPIIPGVKIPGMPIYVPLHGWLSLFIILVVHEGMHGIAARKIGVKLKNAGVLLLGLLPMGAFVEPDDKCLAKADARDRLKLYGAGPAANFVVAMLALLLSFAVLFGLAFSIGPWVNDISGKMYTGIQVIGVDKEIEVCGRLYESPSFGKVEEGMVITKVNGKKVNNTGDFLRELGPAAKEPFELTLSKDGIESRETITPNELGWVGFRLGNIENPDYAPPPEYAVFDMLFTQLAEFTYWFIILGILIAMANYIPMGIFDGGRMSVILVAPYFRFLGKGKKETERLVGKAFFWIVLVLILINALPFFI